MKQKNKILTKQILTKKFKKERKIYYLNFFLFFIKNPDLYRGEFVFSTLKFE